MILVNNLCDFHDLYSYFTLCNVCYVFQLAKSRQFIYFIYLLSRNSTISTTEKCFNYAAHIWIFCVAWSQWRHQLSQSRRFRRDLFHLCSCLKQLLCIIHALGEWEVYRRKCFFEFFWCWDLYPSGRFVLQVSRLQNTGVKLGHAKMFRALQVIGKFRIPNGPWTSTIARLMRVNFFAKTNVGNLPLSRWKTIEILKNSKISKLKLYQRHICCKQQNCGKST